MIDIVVGGQFGSEGKGKVTYWLTNKSDHKCAVRVGGSNSGHTINGEVLRHLPASALIPGGTSIIGAGSYIDPDLLEYEINRYKPTKLLIDSKAVIIRGKEAIGLQYDIGSTLSGTGIGVVDRIQRKNTIFITKYKRFHKYLANTEEIQGIVSNGCVIEGTQGFGLSNLHTPYYPYCTSRDTTAAGFMSELGVSPNLVGDIYLVLRSFPIRVSGNSGSMEKETNWRDLGLREEFTSVTGKVRRVAYFTPEIVKKAIAANNPSYVVMNHLDYIEEGLRAAFIQNVERTIQRRVNFIGLNPDEVELWN